MYLNHTILKKYVHKLHHYACENIIEWKYNWQLAVSSIYIMVASCAAAGCTNSRKNILELSFFNLSKDVEIKESMVSEHKVRGKVTKWWELLFMGVTFWERLYRGEHESRINMTSFASQEAKTLCRSHNIYTLSHTKKSIPWKEQ